MKKIYLPLLLLALFFGGPSMLSKAQPCAPFTPYFSEPFNTFLPNVCWNEADAGSIQTGPSSLGTGPWGAGTAIGNTVKINLYTTTRSDWVLSPAFDLSAGGYELLIDVAVTNWLSSAPDAMGSDDTVRVAYTENGTTWNTLMYWTVQDNLPNNLITYSVPIPSTGSNVQFGILATDGPINDLEDYDFHIDNFIIQTPPACPAPTALSTTAITATSADLTWTDPSGTQWDIEWGPSGFTPTGTPMITGVISYPYTLSGLSSTTAYDYYVRSDCGASGVSIWSGPYTFTTPCAAFTPAYLETFATFVPNTCWDEANTGNILTGPLSPGSSPWASGSVGGNPSVRINLYNTSHSDWILSPQFDLSATSYELSLDVAVTTYLGSLPDVMGADDTVRVVYTEDGITWNNLMMWTVSDNLPNTLTTYSTPIPSTGTHVQFGILATDGPVDNPEDYDFHVDNFQILPATGLANQLITQHDVNIFPNPNNGQFTVVINPPVPVKQLSIQVVNLQGQVVFEQSAFDSLSAIHETIDLSNQAPGIYFVVVTTDRSTSSHKLVIR
ncbi:MAG: T9SS type A sorting domain-containing protein [Flavobacteriales bacterium]|nr:T9SS type A sorting domain-containing protein [Flavobacteriales bacterium]